MGAILLAMTIGGLMIAAISLIFSILTKRAWLRNFVLGGAAVWIAFYAVTLLAASVFSREKTLSFNEPKKFCGFYLDCHLSARVTGIRRARTFGSLKAKNEFYIVKVKIESDARQATLALSDPKFTIIDDAGKRYEPSEDLTVTVEVPKFEEKIPAGGALEDELAFDLPADASNPRLDIQEGLPIERAIETILIGDEDSLLHKRAFFRLAEQPATAGVK